jgi:hypothetical protein
MELEDSLPSSQLSATGLCPRPHESSARPNTVFTQYKFYY